MRGSKPIILAGAIILTMGSIFHLQGQAVVGPQASFMYSNPDWVSYGMYIAIVGITLIVTGLALSFVKCKK